MSAVDGSEDETPDEDCALPVVMLFDLDVISTAENEDIAEID